MSENAEPTEERICDADALFILRQFEGLYPQAYVTVAAVTALDKTPFRHHIPLQNLTSEWNAWVLAALSEYNRNGLAIKYNVNPTFSPHQKKLACLATLAACFSTRHVGLADRLRQMAVLHKTGFEPSYVVQWAGGLCGVYILDAQLTRARHDNLSRHLAHLIDSASVKESDHPFYSIPLPGFLYKKKLVKLLHPPKPTQIAVRFYSAGEFERFPEVTMENVERFYKEAQGLGDEKALEFVTSLLREAREKGDKRAILVGIELGKRRSDQEKWKELGAGFVEPHKAVIPHFRAIRAKYWSLFWHYVRFGPNSLEDILAKLVMRILNGPLGSGIERNKAMQGLDCYLIREMILAGYTCRAVVDFFSLPGHNIGAGKSADYLAELYNHEIAILRVTASELAVQDMRVTPQCFEFISTVCAAIDRIGDWTKLRGAARVDGDCLSLHVKRAHARLYLAEMALAGRVPIGLKQMKFIFQNCSDHYWLGRETNNGHYQWRFSVSRLQQHGLLKIFKVLTK